MCISDRVQLRVVTAIVQKTFVISRVERATRLLGNGGNKIELRLEYYTHITMYSAFKL
jgi:hypothetical protein